jgi:hypothetical protein
MEYAEKMFTSAVNEGAEHGACTSRYNEPTSSMTLALQK